MCSPGGIGSMCKPCGLQMVGGGAAFVWLMFGPTWSYQALQRASANPFMRFCKSVKSKRSLSLLSIGKLMSKSGSLSASVKSSVKGCAAHSRGVAA